VVRLLVAWLGLLTSGNISSQKESSVFEIILLDNYLILESSNWSTCSWSRQWLRRPSQL